jgi:putative transposase
MPQLDLPHQSPATVRLIPYLYTYDNAMCESFFSTLEYELLSRRRFASQAEAKIACFSYIEGFYNPVRLHSALGYLSPIAYEQENAKELATET